MTAPAQKSWRRRLSSLTAAAFALALITAGMMWPETLASASSGHAWTGKGDGTTWGDARNWAGNSVPQNGDSVTIGWQDQTGQTQSASVALANGPAA